MKKFIYFTIFSAMVALCFTACKDQWEEHNEVINPQLNKTLMQVINENSDLSIFSDYLVSTGYDELLASNKSFTVWAPNNAALSGLSNEVKDNPERLKVFIGNHIGFQSYFTTNMKGVQRMKMVNGKYNTFSKGSGRLENAEVLLADQRCFNGVLHVINSSIIPKPSIWELLHNQATNFTQSTFIQSLSKEVFVDSIATQTGIDPITGKPVYDSITGMVFQNAYLDEVLNIKSEDALYTFFLLTDDAFEVERNKLERYFQDTDPEQTIINTNWSISKDLVFEGIYTVDNVPDTLITETGVRVPINRNEIVETLVASNGLIHIINKCDFKIEDKVPVIIIQGEAALQFYPADRRSNIFYRYREIDGEVVMDLNVRNHGVARFAIRYLAENANSVKYNFYWRTINDFQNEVFNQKLSIKDRVAATFPYIAVERNDFEEKFIGEYTVTNYADLTLYVEGANSTANAANPITVDYIKMVPVFE